ncbi:hypothetical protein KPH14_003399 [Odynerus spinipes]|uniref:Uncharacterized protein n=1 Tax=Odynerus spinipes TaxID=1348599 RepID=A0AAD9RCK3_9HYME|nr:hypothetical protein KPH14_003399 [Odynerus spinipes]
MKCREYPKSRKSVSKRSSILKAPVVQQSSQNVKSDVSLYQESPAATKQKRRVSFAGKKHVKEFCDSVEQGTVWDITYEESSVEHTGQIELNNQYYKTINNDHHGRNVGKETNENGTVTNKSLDLTEPISTMGSLRPICAEEALIQKSISIVCQNTNKNEANHSISIKSNSNIGVPADKNIIVYNDASSLNDIENAELNQTCVQDVSMEVTEIPYVIRSQNIIPMTHKQLLEDKENIPMCNIINKFDVLPTIQNEVNMMSDKTQYFCTERLEFTECLQFVTKLPELQPKSIVIQHANVDVNNQKTQIFQNTSMEITGAIPLNQNKDSIDQTVIFHDTSMGNAMEVTPIINKQGIRKIFQNESMAITAALHMPNIIQHDIPKLNDVATNVLRNNEDITSSNTKIFQNESMAITAPLHMPNILQRDIPELNVVTKNLLRNNEDITSSNTKIFQNESMAITAPLHIPNILQRDIPELNDVTTNVLRNNEDTMSLNTKVFQNMSMEITSAITNLPILGGSEKLSESTEEDYANLNKNEKKDKATVSNKSVHELVTDTLNSGTMNYIEDFEDSSTEPQPLNGLTSLISSFVYADMIEEDSFGKEINENDLQSTKSDIVQETKSQQSNVNTKFIVDTTNVEVINIQFPDKCITRNEDTTKEHENIQENNVIVNTEENNQCDPKLFLSNSNEIHENIFENCTNRETISDNTTEKEISRRNKQLNETKKDVERHSATYIIKSKKNLNMDVDKYIDDHSINNQISPKSFTLSPTSLFTSNKDKMCTTENNLIADVTDKINFNDSDVKENSNDSSLNEKVNHVTLHEKPKESSTFQKGTFSSLIQQLKMYMHSNDCIWDLCHEDIDKQMLVVSFISASLLVVIFTQNDVNTATCVIKRINIISRLKDDEKNVQLSIAHKLIKEKINVEHINQLFKYDEDVVPLLNHISEDVKLVLDFVFDLQKLDDTNLMKINSERITFIVRSKCMNILLEVTVDVKLFDTINLSDINIVSILGTVRKEDIKKLIINIKRDYKFLRRYMSDIKAYIDIIEQADLANKKSCS